MGLNLAMTIIQFFFVLVIGLYFLNLLRTQQGTRVAVERESAREMERLKRLRDIALNEPLSERTRPKTFADVVGQAEGMRALKAALCGPNPQHVLVYGPPGIGKTAAARLVLQEAQKSPDSPFKPNAAFVELDATTARFDERGIAEPLRGDLHIPTRRRGTGSLGGDGIRNLRAPGNRSKGGSVGHQTGEIEAPMNIQSLRRDHDAFQEPTQNLFLRGPIPAKEIVAKRRGHQAEALQGGQSILKAMAFPGEPLQIVLGGG